LRNILTCCRNPGTRIKSGQNLASDRMRRIDYKDRGTDYYHKPRLVLRVVMNISRGIRRKWLSLFLLLLLFLIAIATSYHIGRSLHHSLAVQKDSNVQIDGQRLYIQSIKWKGEELEITYCRELIAAIPGVCYADRPWGVLNVNYWDSFGKKLDRITSESFIH